MIRKIFTLCSILLLIVVSISASNSRAAESAPLRLALLPIPDVFPAYVAEAQGYFAKENVTVELLPVGSAVERDQLMQAGRIDGMINEISGAVSFNRQEVKAKIVSIARSPLDGSPLFRVLAAPKSTINTITDLTGVPIGISKNTIIEYITNRLLTANGVREDAIVYQSVPVLPERLQLLLSGQIKAATLPDPLGFSAVQGGAREIVNDTAYSSVSASVITFTVKAITEKTEAVGGFMRAWDRGAADVNSDPENFRALMLQKIRVPKNVQQSYRIPQMPRKALPTEDQWNDVMAWMISQKLLEKPLDYHDCVTSEFIEK
jgi:NitT/TauT family transport system substrate-binding protein